MVKIFNLIILALALSIIAMPSLADEKSPLTEEEQRYFEKIGGDIITPQMFEDIDIKKYIIILLKGSPKTIRWYKTQEYIPKNEVKKYYEEALGSALSELDLKNDKEGLKLAIEVIETKKDYPTAISWAAGALGRSGDKSVIPLLRECLKSRAANVRSAAACSLMELGDVETALPVMDELVNVNDYDCIDCLFKCGGGRGKIRDERGYGIIEKALESENKEVKLHAATILYEDKKVSREKGGNYRYCYFSRIEK